MNRGRVVGLLFLAQGPIAPIANFALLQPVMGADYVAQAPAHAGQVRGAVALWFVYGALTLGIAAVAMPVFRRRSDTLASWFLGLSVLSVATLLLENAGLLTMLAVSQQAAAAGAIPEGLQTVAGTVRSARIAAHFLNLTIGAAVLFLFYLILTRFALIPRILAGIGAASALLLIAAVGMPLFDYPVSFALMTPIGLSNLAMTGYLLVRGFRESEP